MAEIEKVTKGGVCWFEMSISRGKKGLAFYVKADPRVEEFFAGIGNGIKDPLEAYGRDWYPLGDKGIEVYNLGNAKIPTANPLQNPRYTVSNPTEGLVLPKTAAVNISFLRFVGVGSPDGVTFGISGPYSKDYIRDIQKVMAQEIRNLIRDYIVPVNLNLRISSTEI
ncbi:MAG TPA: hypothetical protein VM577_06880 [Anaerovoracaceae bacterium]|nr:hypothetical protein [Anaerovoracaceae bacterium]